MSGLDIVYSGKGLIEEESLKAAAFGYSKQPGWKSIISFETNYNYKFKTIYIIRSLVKNSVADKVGLKTGDTVLSINTKLANNYTLSDIINKLQERKNKKIQITIIRNDQKMTFKFRLEKEFSY
jgi:C-terminal processing protease CtpA/Prc